MNVSSLFRMVCRNIGSITPKTSSLVPLTNISRNMHHMCNKSYLYDSSNAHANSISSVGLLQSSLPIYNLICGLKMKVVLHRRCKDCVVMWKNDRKYIICKTHGRHNQVERKKKSYKTWILTHASQSKVREW